MDKDIAAGAVANSFGAGDILRLRIVKTERQVKGAGIIAAVDAETAFGVRPSPSFSLSPAGEKPSAMR